MSVVGGGDIKKRKSKHIVVEKQSQGMKNNTIYTVVFT